MRRIEDGMGIRKATRAQLYPREVTKESRKSWSACPSSNAMITDAREVCVTRAWAYFTRYRPSRSKGATMSSRTRDAKQQSKARQRRRLHAQERLARDRRQAQHAAAALQQALNDLGLPEDLVVEIEGRLQSQQKLLGRICGVMFPPLFGCRTNSELCRVRGWDKNLPSRLLSALPKRSWLKRLRRLGLEVLVPLWQ
jgi:hypothetical protein